MWKPFWYATGAFFFVLAGVIWASTQSTFLFIHPTAPDARIEIDFETGAAVVVAHAKGRTDKPGDAAAGVPRAEVPEREFEFGTMNPLTMGRHEFLVRNVGTAPLELKLGPTTCKCTLGKLADNKLLPGEESHVTLEWNTGRKLQYSHAGTLLTNDPNLRQIELRVTGRVLTVLDADVKELVFPKLLPNEGGKAQTFLYSGVWDAFEVVSGECSLAGATWAVEPCTLEKLPDDIEARHAQLLTVQVPGDLPSGPFTGTLRLAIRDPQSGDERELVLPLQGTVLRRLSVYGPAIDGNGLIDLGKIAVGRGKKVKLVVKVRDELTALDFAQVVTTPAFLKAEFRPRAEDEGKGLYDLTVEVPADTPVCQHLVDSHGQIRIDTGHPRIGVVELPISFAVVPRL
jgi:hypothetical protein